MLAKTSALPGLGVAALTIAAIDRPRGHPCARATQRSRQRIAALCCTPYLVWAAKNRGGLFGVEGALRICGAAARAGRPAPRLSDSARTPLYVPVVLVLFRLD
jgi:hypothetical protein